MSIRTVFMGSPDFAVPTLRTLAALYPVIGVITQPDRPSGRGRKITPPPVKQAALELGIEVIQPQRLREPEAIEMLESWAPDLIVVAAYGQILRKNVLEMPPHGCINVHASLLPRWRGAAPIQAAILHGDPMTGSTIMKMDSGIDTGPILSQQAVPILPDDTAESLSFRLADAGAELLAKTLPAYIDGKVLPQPQEESGATYAGMLSKEEGKLDFDQPADALERRVRAFHPWPGAFTFWQGSILKVHRAHSTFDGNPTPGKFGVVEGAPAIGTAHGWLVLDEVQPAGKKPMPGKVFLHGNRGWESFASHT